MTDLSQTDTYADLRVLLVEDSAVLAQRLKEAIGQVAGVALLEVLDTEDAAILYLGRHRVDVVVLDLHLRQGTGFGVMRALAAYRHKPTFIVLSNYELPEYRTKALHMGAAYFLDKAHDYDRLPQLLDDMEKARRAAPMTTAAALLGSVS